MLHAFLLAFKKFLYFCHWVESWHSIKKALTGKWHSTLQKSTNLFRWKAIISPKKPLHEVVDKYNFFFFDLTVFAPVKKSWKVASLLQYVNCSQKNCLKPNMLFIGFELEVMKVREWGEKGGHWGARGWSWGNKALCSHYFLPISVSKTNSSKLPRALNKFSLSEWTCIKSSFIWEGFLWY